MLLSLFIAALCSPTGNGLTSWLFVGDVDCIFVTLPCGILGQVMYFNVSFLDCCRLSYFQDQLLLNTGESYCRSCQIARTGASTILSIINSYHLSLRSLFCPYLSGHIQQVLFISHYQ